MTRSDPAADPRPDPTGNVTLTDLKLWRATGAWRGPVPTLDRLRHAMTAYLAWGEHRRGKWQFKTLPRIAFDFAGLVPKPLLLEWIAEERPKVAERLRQDAAKTGGAITTD